MYLGAELKLVINHIGRIVEIQNYQSYWYWCDIIRGQTSLITGLLYTIGNLSSIIKGIDPVVIKYQNINHIYCKFRYAVHMFKEQPLIRSIRFKYIGRTQSKSNCILEVRKPETFEISIVYPIQMKGSTKDRFVYWQSL